MVLKSFNIVHYIRTKHGMYTIHVLTELDRSTLSIAAHAHHSLGLGS
jgi:hypothetical protein